MDLGAAEWRRRFESATPDHHRLVVVSEHTHERVVQRVCIALDELACVRKQGETPEHTGGSRSHGVVAVVIEPLDHPGERFAVLALPQTVHRGFPYAGQLVGQGIAEHGVEVEFNVVVRHLSQPGEELQAALAGNQRPLLCERLAVLAQQAAQLSQADGAGFRLGVAQFP